MFNGLISSQKTQITALQSLKKKNQSNLFNPGVLFSQPKSQIRLDQIKQHKNYELIRRFIFNVALAPSLSDQNLFYIQTNRMHFVSKLFGGHSIEDLPISISKTLSKLKIDSLQPLPQHYIQKLLETTPKVKPQLVFKQIVKQLDSVSSASAFIKTITIVFQWLRRQNYSQVYLEQMEELQLKCSKNFDSSQNQWVKDLDISCITFLRRAASFGDVFKRAIGTYKDLISQQVLSIDLLRMTNLYSLLFPKLNIAMNTVGRYYKKSYLFFEQFYNVMRDLLVTGYQYMKYICDKFMNAYQAISPEIIQIFNKVIPEVQLLCDQMQEFMTSKYYRGKGVSKKIYFSDDKIQELNYHLLTQKRDKMEKTEKTEKNEELLDTADSDYFSNAKAKCLQKF